MPSELQLADRRSEIISKCPADLVTELVQYVSKIAPHIVELSSRRLRHDVELRRVQERIEVFTLIGHDDHELETMEEEVVRAVQSFTTSPVPDDA